MKEKSEIRNEKLESGYGSADSGSVRFGPKPALLQISRFGFLIFFFGFCLPALAFHESGVAHCDACHVMHNSEDGTWIDPTAPGGRPMLLKFATATDACLSCHGVDLGAEWGSDPLHPPTQRGAGNFVFLMAPNLNDGPNGNLYPISGSHAGHSVVSDAHSSPEDPNYQTAPGGTYPSNALGCTSCHNPHGNTNYRMLYGQGNIRAGDYTFVNPAPQAHGLALNSGPENTTNHTGYISGMSAWCANCHGTYHSNGAGQFQHPSDQLLSRERVTDYNTYAGSSNPTGGNYATAYLPEVPFEDLANTISSTAGPTLSSRISCVTCHRAHASSGPYAGRWDFNVTYLRQDGVVSGSFPIANPFSDINQKSLCCKCHVSGEQHSGEQSCISCHMGNVTRALRTPK